MTAITAAVNRQRKGQCKTAKVAMTASITIPKGALVSVDLATGLAKNAVGSALDFVVGVAAETVTTTAAGGSIEVEFDAIWLFAATSITQAMVGNPMLVVDNNTVDETNATGSALGVLVEFLTTTLGWVYVAGIASKL